MSWLSKNYKVLQVGLLVLLAASFFAPWNYEADGVPPPEYCAAPLVLLTPESCVRLISGAGMLGYGMLHSPQLLLSMFTGERVWTSVLREIAFVFALLLPALPLLGLAWRVLTSAQSAHPVPQPGPAEQIVFYVCMGLGWFAALGLFLLHWPPQPWLFWGLWLYLFFNDATVMLNVLAQSGSRKALEST